MPDEPVTQVLRRRFRSVTRARIPTSALRGMGPSLRERNEKAVREIGGIYDDARAKAEYDELIARGRPKKR